MVVDHTLGSTCHICSVSKERVHQFCSSSLVRFCAHRHKLSFASSFPCPFHKLGYGVFFLGRRPFPEVFLLISVPNRSLSWTLPRQRTGCGTIVANCPLNLLFKSVPFNLSNSCTLLDCLHEAFDVTICLSPRCDFSVPERLFLGIFRKFGPIKRGRYLSSPLLGFHM